MKRRLVWSGLIRLGGGGREGGADMGPSPSITASSSSARGCIRLLSGCVLSLTPGGSADRRKEKILDSRDPGEVMSWRRDWLPPNISRPDIESPETVSLSRGWSSIEAGSEADNEGVGVNSFSVVLLRCLAHVVLSLILSPRVRDLRSGRPLSSLLKIFSKIILSTIFRQACKKIFQLMHERDSFKFEQPIGNRLALSYILTREIVLKTEQFLSSSFHSWLCSQIINIILHSNIFAVNFEIDRCGDDSTVHQNTKGNKP